MKFSRGKRTPKAAAITGEPPTDASLEMRGLELVHRFEDAPEGEFHLAWSAAGALLAAGAEAGAVAVWSEDATQPRHLDGHSRNGSVLGVAWHPRRETLATAGRDGTVRLWDPGNGESRVLCRPESKLSGVAWSPDGSRLAVTDMDGGIGVWDAETGGLLTQDKTQTGWLYRPCWSADGTRLMTGDPKGGVNVLASNDLQRRQKLSGGDGNITDIALSPDGQFIAAGHMDVRVWNLVSGAEVAVLESPSFGGSRYGVGCVCFSPNGEFLASKSSKEVRLWRCRDWECVAIRQSSVSRLSRALARGRHARTRSQPIPAARRGNCEGKSLRRLVHGRSVAAGAGVRLHARPRSPGGVLSWPTARGPRSCTACISGPGRRLRLDISRTRTGGDPHAHRHSQPVESHHR